MGKRTAKDKLRRKTARKKFTRRLFKAILFGFLICCVLLAGLLGYLYYKYADTVKGYQRDAEQLVGESHLSTFRQSESSFIFDSEGNQIAKLKSDKDVQYLEYSEIPQKVIDSFVAVEDRRYYQHAGVDFKSVLKAAYLLVRNRGEVHRGGSTITQQLARGVFLTNEVSYERKLKEIFIAQELERKYTKEQILEFYINNVYFANGCYGIGAASQAYFSKPVVDLSLSQVAFLCAIPNSPTRYDPLVAKGATITRRDVILGCLLEQGKCSNEEYEEALTEAVELSQSAPKFYNYEASYAIHCAVEELMKSDGFEFEFKFKSKEAFNSYNEKYDLRYAQSKELLSTGGYVVKTSIVPEQQLELQKCVDDTLSFNKEIADNGVYSLQGAATVVDNDSGKVTAIVGGRSQEVSSRSLNRAYQSFRQPGSAIKPLIVYTPFLEGDGINKFTKVNDSRIKDGPSNSNGRYSGKITLHRAVEQSKNVVAWRIFDMITPKVGLGFIQDMEFRKIVKDDEVLPASLGGLTYGTNTVEMASAYSTLENDGNFRSPTCITSITDNHGNEIYTEAKSKEIYSKRAARNMTEILEGVIKVGTGKGLRLKSGMISAGKTGTTNASVDGWFCGYTPYYSVAAWVGFDTPKEFDGLMGGTYPGQIWKSIQSSLNADKELVAEFPRWTKEDEVSLPAETPAVTKVPAVTKAPVVTNEPVVTEDPDILADNSLVVQIKKKLKTYKALEIVSDESISEESSLYNTILGLINEIHDANIRADFFEKLDNLETIKSKEITELQDGLDSLEIN